MHSNQYQLKNQRDPYFHLLSTIYILQLFVNMSSLIKFSLNSNPIDLPHNYGIKSRRNQYDDIKFNMNNPSSN